MIVSRVRRTLVERKLVDRGMSVLAACSGGPDSAAMLFVLARLAPELGFTLSAASVDHGLRESAPLDVEIARIQAEKAGVPFYPLKIHVKKGASVQVRAREERYAILRELADDLKAHRIAVGHTQDDQAESVIMRILRGAGLGGLSGTVPLRADGVIRPLIDCRRQEVHGYARQKCSKIARDPSNLDMTYERVRIREQILPALAKENPAIIQHLADLADDARDQEKALFSCAEQLLQEAKKDSDSLSRSILRASDRATRRAALRLWVHQQTGIEPGRAHMELIDRALVRRGEIWLPKQWVVFVTKDAVVCKYRARAKKKEPGQT
jgi:tRNA(Ile)-lysidine synthase